MQASQGGKEAITEVLALSEQLAQLRSTLDLKITQTAATIDGVKEGLSTVLKAEIQSRMTNEEKASPD